LLSHYLTVDCVVGDVVVRLCRCCSVTLLRCSLRVYVVYYVTRSGTLVLITVVGVGAVVLDCRYVTVIPVTIRFHTFDVRYIFGCVLIPVDLRFVVVDFIVGADRFAVVVVTVLG